jgi:hypothetical protein
MRYHTIVRAEPSRESVEQLSHDARFVVYDHDDRPL